MPRNRSEKVPEWLGVWRSRLVEMVAAMVDANFDPYSWDGPTYDQLRNDRLRSAWDDVQAMRNRRVIPDELANADSWQDMLEKALDYDASKSQ